MKKSTLKNLIVILAFVLIVLMLAWTSPPNENEVSYKLSELCSANPDKDCKAIVRYCQESLEKGFDCLID